VFLLKVAAFSYHKSCCDNVEFTTLWVCKISDIASSDHSIYLFTLYPCWNKGLSFITFWSMQIAEYCKGCSTTSVTRIMWICIETFKSDILINSALPSLPFYIPYKCFFGTFNNNKKLGKSAYLPTVSVTCNNLRTTELSIFGTASTMYWHLVMSNDILWENDMGYQDCIGFRG
jgi:hypothetical protein